LEVDSNLNGDLKENDESHESDHLWEGLFDIANIAEIENGHFDGEIDNNEEEVEEFSVASNSEHVHLV